jgi:drug/metabolite transporter (DMT)-like permease
MLCGSFSFAIMGACAHALGKAGCDWRYIALSRSSLAMILGATLALVGRARLVFFKPGILWLRSLAGSTSLVFTFYAITRLRVSDVLTLTNTFPIWIALISWPVYRERPSLLVWFSILCGVFGVVLIQRPHFMEGNVAALLALFSAFFSALAMLGLHQLKGIDPRAIVTHFSTVAVLFCLGSFLVLDFGDWPALSLDTGGWLTLLGVGVSATIGQLFLTLAFTSGAPSKVAVVGLTQVVYALGFDLCLWGYHFDLVTLLGMLLVLLPTGLLMMQQKVSSE